MILLLLIVDCSWERHLAELVQIMVLDPLVPLVPLMDSMYGP